MASSDLPPDGSNQPVSVATETTPEATEFLTVRLTDGSDYYTAGGGSGGLTDAELRATPVPMSGTVTANAGTGTLAVSAAALPLPSGAATVAKQPALGTAGTAAADVITVQGIASMTALKVDGSAVTQPVSGTVTANPWAALSAAIDGVLTLTTTGDNELIAAGGGGTRAYITSISASNSSYTGVRIDFKDGTTVKHSFYLAPTGGGVSHVFPFPWRLADNAVLNVAISAAVTDVRVSANGFRG